MNNNSTLQIRIALPEEYVDIANFQLEMAFETEGIRLNKATVQAGVRAVFDDSSLGKYYVALNKGEVIASLLTTYEWSDWRNGTVLWIQSVYVKPEFRKQGVFKEMYNFIVKFIRTHDTYKGIRLYVDESNSQAKKVYETLGMDGDHYKVFEWMKQ